MRAKASVVCVLAAAGIGITAFAGTAPGQSDSAPVGFLAIRRIYVDTLGSQQGSAQLRDMIIASLQQTGLFQLTETPERADAVLRGTAEDLIFNDQHQYSEDLSIRIGGGFSRSEPASGRSGTERNAGTSSVSVGERESGRSTARQHEASAAVRLVNREGDVVWSTSQHSRDGKRKNASQMVAEQIAKQLMLDVEKAKARSARPGGEPLR